ncbi:hypothetical protein KUV85_11235 [Nocardioides panacisoli]|uniref:hypothetical protein n=1 Tax=Nocardioides panacisoli TaxID=627624 RepID=UPI001C62E3C7|nr:hypothetical protein [Nocardioides panacisoli]QYJ02908.1 hypothetical protein KUV85_11235 [Nocardioides panacisoli]
MSQDAKATRPGQATFAGWLILGGSVIVVITAWQRISGLTSMETRENLQSLLTEPPLAGTGMELGDLTMLVRIGCMAAAAAATAAAILGFHALRRSTSARLALSFLAPVLLVGGFATAGFFAPIVVAGIVMLWLTPSREWFAGQPWRHKVTPPQRTPTGSTPNQQRVDPGLPDPFTKPEQDAEQGNEPAGGHGAPQQQPTTPSAPAAVSGFGSTQTAQAPYAAPPAPRRSRPMALVWACAVVWSMSALVSAMMLLLTGVLLVAREEFFAEVERQQPDFDFQGFGRDEIATGVFSLTAFVVVWSAIAIVLAVLAFRGSNGARVALIASTVGVGVVCLATVLASPPSLVVVAAAAATTWLLLRPDVVGWFRDR